MTCSVNRYLENKDMDHLDHALGRPVNPLDDAQCYRNRFATDAPKKIEEFLASPNWRQYAADKNGMAYFEVTEAGRKALAEHLKSIRDPHRLYAVTYDHGDGEVYESLVPAKSRSAAKYSRYLDISDFDADLTFRDFCKRVSVRLA